MPDQTRPPTIKAPQIPVPDDKDIASGIIKQIRQSERWRMSQDTSSPVIGEHVSASKETPEDENGNTHPGIWKNDSGYIVPEGDIRDIADVAGGLNPGRLDAKYIYRSYKHSPHTPCAIFGKYLAHRYHKYKEYNDPQKAHKLDKAFLKLVQKGGASDKNGHLSISDLHDMTLRHVLHTLPDMLKVRADLHYKIEKGVGLGTRKINGETYVALSRGLNSDIMRNEHPLSSHSDNRNIGFGSVKHHAYVPLKSIWYSYDLGDSYANGNMGPEDEFLVSNVGQRYEAKSEDVKENKLKDGHKDWIPDNTTDEELAQQYLSNPDGVDFGVLSRHPNAGEKFREAVLGSQNGLGKLNAHPISWGAKWIPREIALQHAMEFGAAPQGAAAASQNPNLTTDDLIQVGIRHSGSGSVYWLKGPHINSEVLEGVWNHTPIEHRDSSTTYRLLEHHAASPKMLQDGVDRIVKSVPDSHYLTDAIVKKPLHTEDQVRQIYEAHKHILDPVTDHSLDASVLRNRSWAVMRNLFREGKIPNDIAAEVFNKKDTGQEGVVSSSAPSLTSLLFDNPHAEHAIANMLRSLRAIDQSTYSVKLTDRIREQGGVSPELQHVLVQGYDPQVLIDLAESKGLTQESINALAHHPVLSDHNPLFLNKYITADQIKEAFPKGLPFPKKGEVVHDNPIASAIAGHYYRRKKYEEDKKKHHLIKPLPENLSKSEDDFWNAAVNEWIGKQTGRGYHYVTHLDHAKNILRANAIEPTPTTELLEGHAVIAQPDSDSFLEVWSKTPQIEDSCVVYFETDVEPTHLDDARVYWTERLPVENAHIVDVESNEKIDPLGKSEELEKFQTPVLFPKLGINDDRRETKIVNSPLARKTFLRAGANQAVRENVVGDKMDPADKQKLVERAYKTYQKTPALGVTIEDVAGVGQPGHGMKREDRLGIPEAGKGQSAISAAYTPSSQPKKKEFQDSTKRASSEGALPETLQHENTHRLFSRVQHQYGEAGRQMLARNLIRALPHDLQNAVTTHMMSWRPEMYSSPTAHEESITMLQSYLNNPAVRTAYHNEMLHDPEEARSFGNKMKRAYKILRATAEVANENWVKKDKPWLNKAEREFTEPQGEAGLSAAEAHEILKQSNKLSKSYPELFEDPNKFAIEFERNPELYGEITLRKKELAGELLTLPGEEVFGPGEESAAQTLMGYSKQYETAIEAAQFLAGHKEADVAKFDIALNILGSYLKAALVSVGLTDSEKNIEALKSVMELGDFGNTKELSKAEKLFETVAAGSVNATETSEEVRRAVTAGLVVPLNLKGKHSQGAMAARDPETNHLWLLKPGSGGLSSAAGVKDDPSSQSAREAAYWQCSRTVGLEKFFPRADLLLIDGTQVAAVRFLSVGWRSLDELERAEPGVAKEILEPYLQRGDVHRLAAFAWVCGDTDQHGRNTLTDGQKVAGIDHGSAFSGKHYAPATDPKSFVPYILRAFAGKDFGRLDQSEKLKQLPVLNDSVDKILREWVMSINVDELLVVAKQYVGEPAQEAMVARVARLNEFDGSASKHINGLWCGVKL